MAALHNFSVAAWVGHITPTAWPSRPASSWSYIRTKHSTAGYRQHAATEEALVEATVAERCSDWPKLMTVATVAGLLPIMWSGKDVMKPIATPIVGNDDVRSRADHHANYLLPHETADAQTRDIAGLRTPQLTGIILV